MNNTNPQIISVFFIGILLTVSCLNNTQEIRETKLSYDKLVTGWNDSIFIRMCQGLSFFDGRFYISNTEKGYVLACDENLNFVKKNRE